MHPLFLTALITTLAALALYGFILRKMPGEAEPRLLALAVLLALPMEPVSYFFLRVPMLEAARKLLGPDSPGLTVVAVLGAPLTEEPLKLLPIFLPLLWAALTRENCARFALALGLGFGLGEIWLLAVLFAADPGTPVLPFWMYSGFFIERLQVCTNHAAFVTLPLLWARRGWWKGELGAMACHGLANLPLFLAAWNLFGWGRPVWTLLLNLWLAAVWLGGLAWLAWLALGRVNPGPLLFGTGTCPACGGAYERPLLGLNLGLKRWEPCTLCGKWHWMPVTRTGRPGAADPAGPAPSED